MAKTTIHVSDADVSAGHALPKGSVTVEGKRLVVNLEAVNTRLLRSVGERLADEGDGCISNPGGPGC